MSRNLGCLLGLLLVAFLHSGQAIVGAGAARDLVLTPKQGMQATGKRIYYEEQEQEQQHVRERDVRPWERTLKHVTYVTLFTDAAAGAAAGNLSQLHEYHEFLQTPYVPVDPSAQSATAATPSRFGDIITLATGRLEQLPNNGSYRFVEGTGTGSGTGTGQRRALWQVQRIRHRDGDKGRHYHYEIRFSVTPLLPPRTAAPSYQMSYIQKESDYPGSYARLAHEALGLGGFPAQRRNDREREREREREQSQATFIHDIFQPPPPPKLNIGEYLQGGAAPPHPMPLPGGGLFQLGLGRSNFLAPTTFRPNYPTVRLGPEHPGLDTTAIRYPEAPPPPPPESAAPTPAAAAAAAPLSGGVTHHFHHHFYVAPGSGAVSSTQSPPRAASGYYHYQRQQQQQQQQQQQRQPVHFPSSSSGSHESYESNEDPEQELLIRSPQIFGQASKYQTAKLPPLIIYAAAGIPQPNEHEDKSFVQSEPLEETVYRYSEPDPLYVHQNPIDVLHLDEQRLELERDKDRDSDREQEQQEEEQKRASSLDQPEVATTTEVPPATTTTTTTASSSSSSSTVATPTTPAPTVSSASSFVSTSTHFSPLRNLSRYRTSPRITAGRSTTTTTSTTSSTAAPALSKWARRRKEQQDSKAKGSDRHEAYVNSTTAAPAAPSTTAATPTPAVAPLRSDVVEVLTQKSVSRSVSIKVGDNGEEIPFIVDDDENEVSFA
ncbi:mastermind-like protein 2 [Drosophila madeirensis]|uniref:Mastermind-like protein 2 n=1 Tax=Drosophila madeirensis TaxID=30013 RepID=A0AAU9G2L5_DROMD